MLRRFLPQPHFVREHKSLRWLSALLHDPNLFHLNRRSVSLAAGIGVFVGFQPLPMHMLSAAALAVWLRCNITLAVVAVWVSNPLTLPALLVLQYELGARLLGSSIDTEHMEISVEWLEHSLHEVWEPLFLGSVLSGLAAALLTWAATRLLWRATVQLRWRARRRARGPHS
jgi:uncharacterized protein (DUF2062 family)